jgi:hypothetical protein
MHSLLPNVPEIHGVFGQSKTTSCSIFSKREDSKGAGMAKSISGVLLKLSTSYSVHDAILPTFHEHETAKLIPSNNRVSLNQNDTARSIVMISIAESNDRSDASD